MHRPITILLVLLDVPGDPSAWLLASLSFPLFYLLHG